MTRVDPVAFVRDVREQGEADFERWMQSGAPGARGLSRAERRRLERRGDPGTAWSRAMLGLTRLGDQAERVVKPTTELVAAHEAAVRFCALSELWLKRSDAASRPKLWLLVDESAKVSSDLRVAITRAEAV